MEIFTVENEINQRETQYNKNVYSEYSMTNILEKHPTIKRLGQIIN